MPRFRKKPVVVDAIRVKDIFHMAAHDWDGLPDWASKTHGITKGWTIQFAPPRIYINTLNGKVVADIDEWLVRGVTGELYPCKPDIFEQTYEAVEDE